MTNESDTFSALECVQFIKTLESLKIPTWCRNCGLYKAQHMPDGKCLFLPTYWVNTWVDDMASTVPDVLKELL